MIELKQQRLKKGKVKSLGITLEELEVVGKW
jgi:hypothetical protein